ncbi:sensor histidine kinase [Pseudooceanicola algae]|uniref:histidine kinase n=1 Tax=Pseudooceanicola algae TaxID=1537215 RepID=A0A418SK41_9RHOB|nr:ATP-binding protein [Pseudooceanicola algae]QPM92203.1 C4-dicarboxylate transport sensor protein DctB [Pseudooceanicola algae]
MIRPPHTRSRLTRRRLSRRAWPAAARLLAPQLWLRLAAVALVALLCAGLSWQFVTARIDRSLAQALLLSDRALKSEVERFRYLPEVAAEDARIAAALAAPQDATAIAAANAYLETVTAHAGADQLYLLDAEGLTLASSNWDERNSYVGRNYSFRPYFSDAMAGGEGAVYAIGVTTGEPGFFMSTRLGNSRDGAMGVLVVKIDLRSLENTWTETGQKIAVADSDGVVFLSSEAIWRYRPLRPLDQSTRARLTRSQLYVGSGLEGATPVLTGTAGTGLLGSGLMGSGLARAVDGAGRSLSLRSAPFSRGWQVLAAASPWPAHLAALVTAGVVTLTGLLALALLNLRQHRHRLIALRLRQTEVMERKVTLRTAELNHEIDARRKIEADLRAAQETLVHSEKMAALGRMSAAVVHEVSQPLAAMEATLTAAQFALDRAPDQVGARLTTAHGLIRRMQRMTRNLKNFARKEAAPSQPVSARTIATAALELVQPRADSIGIRPIYQPPEQEICVMAGQMRLEQVLVNLLHNALEAIEPGTGQVRLSMETQGSDLWINVTDDGPGIPPDILPRVTEPFFSTKTHSEGLGLGLAISHEIVLQFGGRLDIASPPAPEMNRGTRVSIVLPVLPCAPTPGIR